METQQHTFPARKKKFALTIASWVLCALSVGALFLAPLILLLFVMLFAGLFGADISGEVKNVSYADMIKGSLSSVGFIPLGGMIVGLIAGIRTKSIAAWSAFAANAVFWMVCVVAFFVNL